MFSRDFSCPNLLGTQSENYTKFRLQGCHLLWLDVPVDSSISQEAFSAPFSGISPLRSKPRPTEVRRFRLFPFRSPLLRESRLISFPPATEMFHFTGFYAPTYVFGRRWPGMNQAGLPHSEIPGSKTASVSPRLIAGNHVLHLRQSPRHPPCALSNLTIS